MQYLGDPKGYTQKELARARKIRTMKEGLEKEECIRKFSEKMGKTFPINEPRDSYVLNTSPISEPERNSPEYDKGINELCRNPHKYTFGKLF